MSSSGVKIISPFRANILANHVALITGGGSGIGLEITKQLGLHGSAVVIMGRREEVLKGAVDELEKLGIKAAFVRGDVRKTEDCKRVVEETVAKYGGLDILINSAAGNFLAVAEDLAPKGFSTVLDIDTLGVFSMCHAAFPFLKKSKNALIVNISATLHKPATWFQAHASAAKAAIDSLTRSLSLEWGEYGIRVNGVAPGPIRGTAGMDKLAAGAGEDLINETVPLRRMGEKIEIALCCIYLASSAGQYVSGDTIIVDGGNALWRPQIGSRDMIRSFSRSTEKKHKQQPVGVAKSKL